ncbi:MAG: hypothetical protein K6E34_04925 [Lachnospiraceae bacterium]|nr:hypothetical protein [Lachnospiraceae bacterium]
MQKRKMLDSDKKKLISLVLVGIIVIVLILMPIIVLTINGPGVPGGSERREPVTEEGPAWMNLAGGGDGAGIGENAVTFPVQEEQE